MSVFRLPAVSGAAAEQGESVMARTRRAERRKRERIERLRAELERVQEQQEALQEQLRELDDEEFRLAQKLEKLDPPPPPDPNTLAGMLELEMRETLYKSFERQVPVFEELFKR